MSSVLWRWSGGFAAGLAIGGLFAVGVLVGTFAPARSAGTVAQTVSRDATAPAWSSSEHVPPELSRVVQAAAASTVDNFALATGQVGDDSEGIFALDGESGDLNCWVFYRNTGNFGAQFKTNVLADLGAMPGKRPKLCMVIGSANFLRGAGTTRPAPSICYVADGNSGNMVAYSIVYNQALAASASPQVGTLIKIGQFSARQIPIRD